MRSTNRVRAGFTLLEMLVSVAVLVGLIVLVAQMISGATVATVGSQKRIDSDSTVRSSLGAMANDFAKMIQRPRVDVDYLFLALKGNDKFFFYSEAPGYMPQADLPSKSTVSLVGYRINSQSQLERLGKALRWSGNGSMVFLNFSGTVPVFNSTLAGTWPAAIGSSPDYNGADGDYHTIGEDIFRLEFCFLSKSGSCFQPDKAWQPGGDDNKDGIPNFKELSAVVVAVAALDKKSRALVANMNRLSEAFPDPLESDLLTSPPKMMGATWEEVLKNPDFAKRAGIPQVAASAIRITQKVFYFNN